MCVLDFYLYVLVQVQLDGFNFDQLTRQGAQQYWVTVHHKYKYKFENKYNVTWSTSSKTGTSSRILWLKTEAKESNIKENTTKMLI